MGDKLTDVFMSLFVEKNSDGTRNLRLKGNELEFRIERRIKNEDMYKISTFLYGNPLIVKLELAYNKIGDHGLQILIENLLCSDNNLEHLSLVGCDITHRGIEKLSAVTDTLVLKTLRLTGNKIGTMGGFALENILMNCHTLVNIDVGDTNQTLSSLPIFCAALRFDHGGNPSIKVVDISTVIPTSDMYQYSPSHMADHLGEMIKMNYTLVEIHAQKCGFDGHDVGLLLLGLRRNTTLLLLDIGFNRISNFGAEQLAEWFGSKPNLIGLNIAGNSIGDKGAVALSFGLPFSKIRLLDISYNKIQDDAMAKLLKSVKKEFKLRVFYLWGNEFGQKSLAIFNRQINARVYEQENVDIKIYKVDGVFHVANYPADIYKNRYYCQLEHEEVRELRIKRNRVASEFCDHKVKIKFTYVDRIEGVEPCKKDVRFQPDVDDGERLKLCAEKERLRKEEELRIALEKEHDDILIVQEDFNAEEVETEEKEFCPV